MVRVNITLNHDGSVTVESLTSIANIVNGYWPLVFSSKRSVRSVCFSGMNGFDIAMICVDDARKSPQRHPGDVGGNEGDALCTVDHLPVVKPLYRATGNYISGWAEGLAFDCVAGRVCVSVRRGTVEIFRFCIAPQASGFRPCPRTWALC